MLSEKWQRHPFLEDVATQANGIHNRVGFYSIGGRFFYKFQIKNIRLLTALKNYSKTFFRKNQFLQPGVVKLLPFGSKSRYFAISTLYRYRRIYCKRFKVIIFYLLSNYKKITLTFQADSLVINWLNTKGRTARFAKKFRVFENYWLKHYDLFVGLSDFSKFPSIWKLNVGSVGRFCLLARR